MAFNAAMTVEFRTTGSDSNGGGFNPANGNFLTNWSVSSATTASPVVSGASYTFVAGDVGAKFFLKSGTSGTPGWYPIASVSAGAATLDASIGNVVLYKFACALTRNTAVGCGTSSSLTNQTGGIDYSQQDAAGVAFTDMVIGATTTQFTSAAKPVGKNYVGNIINVASGTGFTVQFVEVVSTSTITATCDKSLGTTASTGGTGNLGGALASPGRAAGLKIASNSVFGKSGSYSVTTSSSNVASGIVADSTSGGAGDTQNRWIGYDTVRGDDAGSVTMLNTNVTSVTLFASSGSYTEVRNFVFDGNAQTSVCGCNLSQTYTFGINLFAKNCTNSGLVATFATFYNCRATAITGGTALNATAMFNCESYGNSVAGIATTFAVDCLSYSNSGGSSDGFSDNGGFYSFVLVNCSARNNGRHNFNNSSFHNGYFDNCVSEGAGQSGTGYGFSCSTGITLRSTRLQNCASYNDTSGPYNTAFIGLVPGFITLSASPFTDGANGDFSLNTTAGGGALLRGAGYGTSPRGASVGYPDVGAVQHRDSGGGLLYGTGMAGGMDG